MARCSTSLALALVAAAAFAQPFGRFGYLDTPQPPGFVLDREGFRAAREGAETVRWAMPLDGLRRTRSTDQVAWFRCAEVPGNPSKVRVDLRAPGWSMYVEAGLRLGLGSLNAPILTQGEASYGEGLPTPRGEWVLLSFADRQPPILFVGESASLQMVVEGRPGDWTLRTLDDHKGWVRVCLPNGIVPLPGASAAALGEAVRRIRANGSLWTGPAPRPLEMRVREEPGSIEGVWVYDRPGALVPVPVVLAAQGGYQARSAGPIRDVGADLEDGPTLSLQGATLRVRFPIRTLRPGRPVTVGPPDVPGPPGGDDPVGLAATLLLAEAGPELRGRAEDELARYLQTVPMATEPLSGARLPYRADGTGMAECGAYAVLQQALARRAGGPLGSLASGLAWRRDWRTWRLRVPLEDQEAGATATLAVAMALCEEPEARLGAALLRAGLAGRVGLRQYRVKRGWAPVPLADPGHAWLLAALFEPDGRDPWGLALASPLRVLSNHRVSVRREAGGLAVDWEGGPGGDPLKLAASLPVTLEPRSGDPPIVVTLSKTGVTVAPARGRAWLRGPLARQGALPETPRLPTRPPDRG